MLLAGLALSSQAQTRSESPANASAGVDGDHRAPSTALEPPGDEASATPSTDALAIFPPAPPAATVALTTLEQELYGDHNAERAKAGVGPLQLDPTLVEIARGRARDMAARDYFAHVSPTGETAFTLLSKAAYVYSVAGENIARNNYPDTQAANVAMTGFMNSAGHRSNILDARFQSFGVAEVNGADDMKYFAVVFAGN